MKRLALLVFLAALLPAGLLRAQGHDDVPEPKGEFLRYQIVNGDTLFVDQLPAAHVWPRRQDMTTKEWRKYYKLVYNFNKVYPYALVGRKMMAQVDSTLAADVK